MAHFSIELYGRLLALLTNIRLGWKGQIRTNTLDFKNFLNYGKCFIKLTSGAYAIMHYGLVIYEKLK
jgi:hypothetical protein